MWIGKSGRRQRWHLCIKGVVVQPVLALKSLAVGLAQSQAVLGASENFNLIDSLKPASSELPFPGDDKGRLHSISQLHRLLVVRVVKDGIRQPQLMCFDVGKCVEGRLKLEVLISGPNFIPIEHNLE